MGTATTTTAGAHTGLARGKYLLFSLDKEQFGLTVQQVREIVGLHPITAVPHMPEFVRGVINLRGKLIPVFDLRLRFGLAQREYESRTCTIVVEAKGRRGGSRLVGLVVDEVSEVVEISEDAMEGPPAAPGGSQRRYVRGLAKLAGGVCVLLAIDELVAVSDFDDALQPGADLLTGEEVDEISDE